MCLWLNYDSGIKSSIGVGEYVNIEEERGYLMIN